MQLEQASKLRGVSWEQAKVVVSPDVEEDYKTFLEVKLTVPSLITYALTHTKTQYLKLLQSLIDYNGVGGGNSATSES